MDGLAAPTYAFSIVHAFSGTDGSCPNSTLVRGSDGDYYGTTREGGKASGSKGTVFRLTPNGRLQTLHTFVPAKDNASPNGVVLGTDGNLYGSTFGDWTANRGGVVYRLSPNGDYSVVHAFDMFEGPQPIIQGLDGAFYGATTQGGGYWGGGRIYRLTAQGEYTVLHTIGVNYTDPLYTSGALVEGTPGTFYGATSDGGDSGFGAIYRVGLDGSFAVMHSFLRDGRDGQQAFAGPSLAPDGSIVGTTAYSTPYASGSVYRIDPAGNYTMAHGFADDGSEGIWPVTGLTVGPRGVAYGTTSASINADMTTGPGTVYQLKNGVLTVLHKFAADGSEGSGTRGALTLLPNRDLMGVTCEDGPVGAGTIFRLRRID